MRRAADFRIDVGAEIIGPVGGKQRCCGTFEDVFDLFGFEQLEIRREAARKRAVGDDRERKRIERRPGKWCGGKRGACGRIELRGDSGGEIAYAGGMRAGDQRRIGRDAVACEQRDVPLRERSALTACDRSRD